VWSLPAPASKAGYSRTYHWRRAARWRGLSWEQWCRLEPDAQAGYIAEYESELRLAVLESEHQRKELERKAAARRQQQAMRRGAHVRRG